MGQNLSNHVGGVDTKMEKGFVEDYGFNPLIRFELENTISDEIKKDLNCKHGRIVLEAKQRI